MRGQGMGLLACQHNVSARFCLWHPMQEANQVHLTRPLEALPWHPLGRVGGSLGGLAALLRASVSVPAPSPLCWWGN